MYALIVCMQVFWVYVFFICIIITSFFRISVFSFNIRLIFLYVISYCLLAWFLSHHRRCCRKTNGGGMRVIRVSRVGLWRWEVKLERLWVGKEESSTKSSRSSFSLCVFLFSVRFVLTTYSINALPLSLSLYLVFLPLNYFMEDLLIDCCLWLLVLRVLFFFNSWGALNL